ncbi:EAL and HDOD domain-containing protein [Thiohalorhabdus methylotrophus]|uniref:EAL and HDOD domain-containing protein n=1 Tax=Thiohalorhabdus methylotrophus TaxID=3242694 RepID=A0ABV4TWD8_9GAMM
MASIFLSRFPLLDRDQKLVGYELQPRSLQAESGGDGRRPDVQVLTEAMGREELPALGGGMPLLVPVTSEMLPRRTSLGLDPWAHLLEVSAEDLVDSGIQGTLDEWRREGGRVAVELGDPLRDPERVGRRVDMYRIDVSRCGDLNTLSEWLAPLKAAEVPLVAIGVHDRGAFDICRDLGCVRFEGQFFAQPVDVTREALPEETTVLFRLFNQLGRRAEIKEVAETFSENPEISERLLHFINSGAFHIPKEVENVRQAMVMLGQKGLQKWVALLLYSGNITAGLRQPLLEESIVRGRSMELVARAGKGDEAFGDEAFIAGALSVMQPLLGRPLRQLVREMHLDREVSGALLHGRGQIGALLRAVIELRQSRSVRGPAGPEAAPFGADRLLPAEEQAVLELEELERFHGSDDPNF